MSQYKQGFVSIDTGTNVVTGSGTGFLGNVEPGDLFKVLGYDVVFEVSGIISDTEIHLTSNWTFNTISNLSYIISRDFTPHYKFPEIHIGDKDWPSILTRNIRKMDSLIYKINVEGAQLPDGILQESRIASIAEIDGGISTEQIVSVYGLSHAISQIDVFSGDYNDLSNKPDFSAHTSDNTNPHNVTANQIGLGSADNTSDADKPISAATQTALNDIGTVTEFEATLS